jgi:hypothetical protein
LIVEVKVEAEMEMRMKRAAASEGMARRIVHRNAGVANVHDNR